MPGAKPSTADLEIFLNRLMSFDARGNAPRRPFGPPELPKGVIPKGARNCLALDSGAGLSYNYLNAMGGEWCGLGFPGYPYLSNLVQRSEYRAPVETIADEMTREWLEFTGLDDVKKKELEEAFTEFQVRECVREAIEQDNTFGCSQIGINIRGQDTDKRRQQPLIVDDKGATIAKGSLLGFKTVEPVWVTPMAYNSNNPMAPDFYKPSVFYVMGRPTHATRLLRMISRPVPDILKPSYNFGGISTSQLIEPYVTRWLKTVDSVNRLISNFSIIMLKTNLLSSIADDDEEGQAGLLKRMAIFTRMRDNQGLFAVDKDGEEMEAINVSLASLDKLQAQAQEHMAAPTHIPLVKLTGITPAGLNANSDGEIKVFYDFIGAQQENVATPVVRTMFKLIQLHLWGKVDPKAGFKWVPLDSPTDKEMSEMRKADGDRDTAYVGAGIVSPDEVRNRLRSDPNSGYTGLEGEAPMAPDLLENEQTHKLGEKGKEADAKRGERSANAQARRDKASREHEAALERRTASKKK